MNDKCKASLSSRPERCSKGASKAERSQIKEHDEMINNLITGILLIKIFW